MSSDLFSWANTQEAAEENAPDTALGPTPISVSQLNFQLKSLIEGTFPNILLEGEISNFKAHSSGHFYFSLKDDKSQISACMFRGANSNLKFKPKDGMQVLVRGSVSVYPPRGSYQMIVQTMEPLGEGALRLAFEQLKQKLLEEGLFDEKLKKSLPHIPKQIAVITSPTGAAIRDILNVIDRRYPMVHVTIFPVRVQGDSAKDEIVRALEMADGLEEFDVIIVARGGGSLEDLWPFNEEVVARAIFKARTPVVSGVGHEIDFTIADFVADLRAPTPSAAAELVVPNIREVLHRMDQQKTELSNILLKNIENLKRSCAALHSGLVDPRRLIQEGYLRLEDLSQQMQDGIRQKTTHTKESLQYIKEFLCDWIKNQLKGQAEKFGTLQLQLGDWMRQLIFNNQKRLQQHTSLLESLNPLAVLNRGYSIVTHNKTNRVVMNSKELKSGEVIQVRFYEGQADATIITTHECHNPPE